MCPYAESIGSLFKKNYEIVPTNFIVDLNFVKHTKPNKENNYTLWKISLNLFWFTFLCRKKKNGHCFHIIETNRGTIPSLKTLLSLAENPFCPDKCLSWKEITMDCFGEKNFDFHLWKTKSWIGFLSRYQQYFLIALLSYVFIMTQKMYSSTTKINNIVSKCLWNLQLFQFEHFWLSSQNLLGIQYLSETRFSSFLLIHKDDSLASHFQKLSHSKYWLF